MDLSPFWYLIILHFIGIGLTVYAAFQARTPQGLMAWGLALIFFPYLGIPLFLLFGKRKLDDYDEIDEKVLNERKKIETMVADFKVVDYSTPIEKFLVNSGADYVRGNSISLLVNADETYAAMLEEIAKAKNFVFVQTFIFRSDSAGERFAEALIKKVEEGVKVYLLYENLGYSMTRNFKKKMLQAGIFLGEFTPARFNKLQFNFRNHRKLVAIDGDVCFHGGVNIGEEYLGLDPSIGHWRDTNVMIKGPAVNLSCLHFIKDWTYSQKKSIEVDFPKIEKEGETNIFILNSAPMGDRSEVLLQHLELINNAKERLWISNPYLVPPQSIVDALMVAAIRGVDVRILVPEKGDNPFVALTAELYIDRLVRSGVKVYKYTEGMLHNKILLADECMALVGSVNFDYRSMYINFENGIATCDEVFLKNLELMLREDFQKSRMVDPHSFKDMSFFKRLGARCLNVASPVL
jgi:cardiolipin synthase A/B